MRRAVLRIAVHLDCIQPICVERQDGKLRLLYEGAPMSFIMEQAGGKARVKCPEQESIVVFGMQATYPSLVRDCVSVLRCSERRSPATAESWTFRQCFGQQVPQLARLPIGVPLGSSDEA